MKIIVNILAFLILSVGTFCSAEEKLKKPSNLSEFDQICSPTECYIILRKLGSGDYGEVFAVENSLGEQFALKSYRHFVDPYLSNHVYTDSAREFSIGQLLNHPNIIKSIELFSRVNRSGNTINNLVLQLVKGETLYTVENRKFSRSEAVNGAISLCAALKYAFTFGLMHMDLHPLNLMVSENSEVIVIDLASFFTLEEMMKYFSSFEDSYTYSFQRDFSKSLQFSTTSVNLKLQQIVKGNPKLHALLQKVKRKRVKNELLRKARVSNPSIDSLDSSSDEEYRNAILLFYSESISENCIEIFLKSNLNGAEKNAVKRAILDKFLLYGKGIGEGKILPIEDYIDTLVAFFGTQL